MTVRNTVTGSFPWNPMSDQFLLLRSNGLKQIQVNPRKFQRKTEGQTHTQTHTTPHARRHVHTHVNTDEQTDTST